MKRSFINNRIHDVREFIAQHQLYLPEFAYFDYPAWQQQSLDDWQEVLDLQLGWDLTDFGSGDFTQQGLTLFTLRNGSVHNDRYSKTYAEKMLVVDVDQETPWHYHELKMEDIINRGGGDLCIELAWATDKGELDTDRRVEVVVDGRLVRLQPRSTLVLKPGQGICLPQRLHHRFWAEGARVLGWEVSMVNDDHTDNYFLHTSSRFSAIEEDEPVQWLLCNEYDLLKSV